MTSSELKNLLQAAADGSETVDLAERALVPRIQHRRRRRATLSVASGLVAAVAIGAIAYGVQPGESKPQVAASPSAEESIGRGPTCGQPAIGRSQVDSPLRLTVTQSVLVGNSGGWAAKVTTVLTNTTKKSIKLTAAPSTVLYLADENGKVASQPTILDGSAVELVLQPDESHSFSSMVNIQRCDPPSSEQPLGYGSYQLYGAHTISQHAGIWDDLPGGPWPVTLK
ncbi:hypothetical protein AB0P21_31840 [Kribbella sp. NPDC056861]|uniref:hypothetical protein n=1 Tax=Kribbella sp. NPDC056861 TaxID=3154857 RepID=UPI0034150233